MRVAVPANACPDFAEAGGSYSAAIPVLAGQAMPVPPRPQ
jgi:hypothetical protein